MAVIRISCRIHRTIYQEKEKEESFYYRLLRAFYLALSLYNARRRLKDFMLKKRMLSLGPFFSLGFNNCCRLLA